MHNKIYAAYVYFNCGSFGIIGVSDRKEECERQIIKHQISTAAISTDNTYKIVACSVEAEPKNTLNKGVCKLRKIPLIILERGADNPLCSEGAIIWEQKANEDEEDVKERAKSLAASGKYGRVWLGSVDVDQLEEM